MNGLCFACIRIVLSSSNFRRCRISCATRLLRQRRLNSTLIHEHQTPPEILGHRAPASFTLRGPSLTLPLGQDTPRHWELAGILSIMVSWGGGRGGRGGGGGGAGEEEEEEKGVRRMKQEQEQGRRRRGLEG